MFALAVALLASITPTTVELSVGPTMGSAPQTGDSDIFVAGAGPGGMASVGADFYLSLNSELVFTPIGIDGRGASYSNFLLGMPVAEAAVDAGWRFYDDGAIRVGAGLGIGAAMVPYSCGDCFGTRLGWAITPHITVTWKVSPWFGLLGRAQLAVHVPLDRFDEAWGALFVAVEPMFSFTL